LFNNSLTKVDVSQLDQLQNLIVKNNPHAHIILKDQEQQKRLNLNFDSDNQVIDYKPDIPAKKHDVFFNNVQLLLS
jgi:hypothetical protein